MNPFHIRFELNKKQLKLFRVTFLRKTKTESEIFRVEFFYTKRNNTLKAKTRIDFSHLFLEDGKNLTTILIHSTEDSVRMLSCLGKLETRTDRKIFREFVGELMMLIGKLTYAALAQQETFTLHYCFCLCFELWQLELTTCRILLIHRMR